MDFKFLHAADLHLDSPLRGLSQYGDAPADLVRTASRDALDNLVARAIAEEVAFVILAGDLYDGDWGAFATGLYFVSAMARLDAAGIDVFVVYGNHDAESRLTSRLPLPPNVKVFSDKKPQTYEHAGTGVRLHGQSYEARDPGGDLAAGYPGATPGAFNIGVLHTALTGDRGHDPYAPCTPDELAAKGYDYWALGHVHGFEVVRADPHIVFPGNLQGRHIRETGPKGAALVEVTDGKVSVCHIALDVVRWALVVVDLNGVEAEHAAHDRVRAALSDALASESDGRPLMVRVRLAGVTALHDGLAESRDDWREGVRAIAAALSDEMWLEKLVVATGPVVATERLNDEFDGLLDTLSRDPDVEAALARDLGEFLSRAPADLDRDFELLVEARAGQFENVLTDAAAALRARLTGSQPS